MMNVYGCMWLREKKREGGMCDRGKERRGAGVTSGVLESLLGHRESDGPLISPFPGLELAGTGN